MCTVEHGRLTADEETATMLPSLKLLLQKLPTRLLVMQCRWEGGEECMCVYVMEEGGRVYVCVCDGRGGKSVCVCM